MEKLRNFYRKYLKNYLVLLFVIAVGIDLVIEKSGYPCKQCRDHQ